MGTREEILEEVTPHEPRLLRVERRPHETTPQRSRAWMLTFDAGRLLVERAVGESGLRVSFGGEAPARESDLVRVDQDDPWWTLLGQSLVRAWALGAPEAGGAILDLQFRRDAENPKRISFAASDVGVTLTWGPLSS